MQVVTETANELTQELDLADADGILRLLRQADAQIWAGWREYPGLMDPPNLATCAAVSELAGRLVQDNIAAGRAKNMIVFSGCGTSGRVGWLCARTYNQLLRSHGHPECFRYLLSGGDDAIVLSIELPEDSPSLGVREFQEISRDAEHVMLVGITCGLSAPYVAGQIDYQLDQMEHSENASVCLIGFNLPEMARTSAVEGWDKTCHSVFAQRLTPLSQQKDSRAFVVTPIVGPEPITASSRMKGGSSTLILLHSLFAPPLLTALNISQPKGILTAYDYFCAFEQTFRATYEHIDQMAQIITYCDMALRHNGHVYSFGSAPFGLWGIVDCAEMVDTYGSDANTFRSFVADGWASAANTHSDISHRNPSHFFLMMFSSCLTLSFSVSLLCLSLSLLFITLFIYHFVSLSLYLFVSLSLSPSSLVCRLLRTSYEQFLSDLLSHVSPSDSLLMFESASDSGSLAPLLTAISALKCAPKVSLITFNHSHSYDFRFDVELNVTLPHFELIENVPIFAEFSLKLITNAISTATQTLNGKVYRNFMINVTVSNNKLFHRSLGLIQSLVRPAPTLDECRTALLRAIHRTDSLTDQQCAMRISEHLAVAEHRSLVVPISIILLTSPHSTVTDALDALQREPVVRKLINSILKQ